MLRRGPMKRASVVPRWGRGVGSRESGQITEQPLSPQLRHSAADQVPAPRGTSVMVVAMAEERGAGSAGHWKEANGLCAPGNDHCDTAGLGHSGERQLSGVVSSKLPKSQTSKTIMLVNLRFIYGPRSEMFSELCCTVVLG